MPSDKAEPFWERFVQLEMCLARTGGSLGKVEKVEARIQEVSDVRLEVRSSALYVVERYGPVCVMVLHEAVWYVWYIRGRYGY